MQNLKFIMRGNQTPENPFRRKTFSEKKHFSPEGNKRSVISKVVLNVVSDMYVFNHNLIFSSFLS